MALGIDAHSYANFHEAKVTFLYPHLTVDFDRKILYGYTDYTIEVLQDYVDKILLDARGVSTEKVRVLNKENGEEGDFLMFTIPKNHPKLGQCVCVPIPEGKRKRGEHFQFRIYHQTSEESGGIQWFTAEQTCGKKHPFMFTQFEAILARTMIPCQDTPSVKQPYKIEVTVPDPLVAACSGNPVPEDASMTGSRSVAIGGKKHLVYEFNQPIPIPSYLIAVAVGDLKRAKIGKRSHVWCEEELLEASSKEFEDTETFIAAGEKLCGLPYIWGTYDLLVLPGKAFPYGGMENPNLTFISSSLITGDKALVDVVAHEIAHSWSGNLVTNASWRDFWLNEGFTMYIERLILGEVHGEKIRHLSELLGYGELIKTVNGLNEDGTPEFTALRAELLGIDPDDAFSRIPYEKGCLLLFYLEKLVGGKEKMIEWLKSYFGAFERKSIRADQMVEHFQNHFKSVLTEKIDWDHWLQGLGMPNYNPFDDLDKTLIDKCSALVSVWKDKGGEGATKDDLKWDPNQTMAFLDMLINSASPGVPILKKEVLRRMDEIYQLTQGNNVEILFRWFMLGLESNDLTLLDSIEDFLTKHGRGVYVKPLFSKLISLATSQNAPVSIDRVKQIYQKNRKEYHSVIRNMFDPLLK